MKRWLLAAFLFIILGAHAQSIDDYAYTYRKDAHGDTVVSGFKIKDSELNTVTLNDSVRLLMKSLALTNLELRRTNVRIRTHAYMTLGAVALEGIGAAFLYLYASDSPSIAYNSYGQPYVPAKDDSLKNIGTACCIIGGVAYLASFIPLIGQHLTADERGLVVRAKIFGKYPKR